MTGKGNSVGVIGQVAFWLVGGALFLTIALLPNLLLAWFYTGGTTHLIVTPVMVVLLGALWGLSALGGQRVHPKRSS